MLGTLLISTLGVIAQAGELELARAIHDAFTANQAAFKAGEAKFQYIKGEAAGLNEARTGEFTGQHEATGRFSFKGDQAYYERLFSAEDMVSTSQSIGSGQTITTLHSFRMATDGQSTMVDWISANPGRKSTHSVSLEPSAKRFDVDFQFPIAVARPEASWGSPRIPLMAAFRNRPDVQIVAVDRDAVFDGHRVVKVVVTYDGGAAEYWLDLERGAIPLQLIEHTIQGNGLPEVVRTTFHDDIRYVQGAGWLPYRQSWWNNKDGACGAIVVSEIILQEPPPSAFAINFETPVVVVDQAKGLTYAARASWDVSKLPLPGSRGVGKVQYNVPEPASSPVLPGEKDSGRGIWFVAIGLASVIAAGGLSAWLRGRSRSAAT